MNNFLHFKKSQLFIFHEVIKKQEEDAPVQHPRAERKPFEEEEEEIPTRRSKYSMAMNNVDVKGLMRPQSKRLSARSRLTSPSPVRRGSDHSHGGVLTVIFCLIL